MKPSLTLLLIALLAGCSTTLRTAQPPEPWTRPLLASDTESLLIYYEWTHQLSAPQVAREYDTVRQIFASSSSDFDRLRCAILLSVPGTAISDLPHAIELLEPVAKNKGASLHLIAFLLQSQFNEQRWLDTSAAELRQKLDALKVLEKDMSGRGKQ